MHSAVEGGGPGAAWLIRRGHGADVKWSKIPTASGGAALAHHVTRADWSAKLMFPHDSLNLLSGARSQTHAGVHKPFAPSDLTKMHRWPGRDKGAALSATVTSSKVTSESEILLSSLQSKQQRFKHWADYQRGWISLERKGRSSVAVLSAEPEPDLPSAEPPFCFGFAALRKHAKSAAYRALCNIANK